MATEEKNVNSTEENLEDTSVDVDVDNNTIEQDENSSVEQESQATGNEVDTSDLEKQLQEEKDKYMLFIEIRHKNLDHLKEFIRKNDDKAFIVVNETKYVQNGFIK